MLESASQVANILTATVAAGIGIGKVIDKWHLSPHERILLALTRELPKRRLQLSSAEHGQRVVMAGHYFVVGNGGLSDDGDNFVVALERLLDRGLLRYEDREGHLTLTGPGFKRATKLRPCDLDRLLPGQGMDVSKLSNAERYPLVALLEGASWFQLAPHPATNEPWTFSIGREVVAEAEEPEIFRQWQAVFESLSRQGYLLDEMPMCRYLSPQGARAALELRRQGAEGTHLYNDLKAHGLISPSPTERQAAKLAMKL